jgi:chromosome segregation ATPase
VKNHLQPNIPFLLLLLCACGSTPPAASPTSGSATPAVTPGPGTLYARDGSVVSAGAQPTRPDQEPKRELGAQEGSRVYLLELYQKAMDEKNALSFEVEGLHATLDEERRVATTNTTEQERLKTELAQVTQERDALKAQAFDLAARVTSAQIARLEAEKALLQLKIEMQHDDAGANRRGGPTSRESRANGGKGP